MAASAKGAAKAATKAVRLGPLDYVQRGVAVTLVGITLYGMGTIIAYGSESDARSRRTGTDLSRTHPSRSVLVHRMSTNVGPKVREDNERSLRELAESSKEAAASEDSGTAQVLTQMAEVAAAKEAAAAVAAPSAEAPAATPAVRAKAPQPSAPAPALAVTVTAPTPAERPWPSSVREPTLLRRLVVSNWHSW